MNLNDYPPNQKFLTRDGKVATITPNPLYHPLKNQFQFRARIEYVNDEGQTRFREYTVLPNGNWGRVSPDSRDIVSVLKPNLPTPSEEELAILSIIL